MTQFEQIKAMTLEEMAEFIKSMVDDSEVHYVACYGCVHYGTHHSDSQYKGTPLYECDGCPDEGIGLDLIKWLEREVEVE